MKLIFRYMKDFTGAIMLSMGFKFISTVFELALPYILEHMIDDVVPQGNMKLIIVWGIAMIFTALVCWVSSLPPTERLWITPIRFRSGSERICLIIQSTCLVNSLIHLVYRV